MSYSRRRLSTDGERQPRRRTASPTSNEKTQCPSCGQWQLTTVNVDGELPFSVCSGCNRGYGIDDSLDAESLALLLRDEELCEDLHITAITCDQCCNNDIYRFVVVEGPHPDRLRVMCMECYSFSDIPLTDWESEEWDNEGPGDDITWMPELLDSEEEDNASLWEDGDSGFVADSEDDQDIWSYYYEDAGIDVLPFSCRCGNNEVDCFQKHFSASSGDLSMVTCLVCDHQKVIESFFGVQCWHCGNGKKELFERHVDDYGRIALLHCFVCDNYLHLLEEQTPRKADYPEKLPYMSGPYVDLERQTSRVANGVLGRTKIEDLRDIKRGDHVIWQRWYAIWHHGIVVDVPSSGRALTVIHYNGGITKVNGHLASVRKETINCNPETEEFYRIDYPAIDTFPVDEVVERAYSRLGEAKYNPFTNNCEHFARWCKTGRAKSKQAQQFGSRMGLASQNAASMGIAEGFESLVAGSLGKVSKFGLSGIRQRAGQVFGATSAKVGALACNVAITLATEAAMFTKDAYNAYSKYKSGAISHEEFLRVLGERGCESVGGAIGAIGGGILGQIFIPIPYVGVCVGSILGNLVGRFLGVVTGFIGNKVKAAIKR